MDKLFYLIGKSSCGKDSIYKKLLVKDFELNEYITYTTRPMRKGEINGKNYYFVNEQELHQMENEGKIIEKRIYNTVCGQWYYFSADDNKTDKKYYLGIGTIESFIRLRSYYGEKTVIPIYIEVDDDLRLKRSIEREKGQYNPQYEEICRRFLADQNDFSEECIKKAGIEIRFYNNSTIDKCANEINDYIIKMCK